MKKIIITKTIVTLLFLISCKKEDKPTPNKFPPANNDLIYFQKNIGGDTGKEAIWQMIESGDGQCYFRGYSNPFADIEIIDVFVGENGGPPQKSPYKNYLVGKISVDGKVIWKEPTGFSNRSIKKIENGDGLWKNALIVTGTSVDSVWVHFFSSGGINLGKYGYGLPLTGIWFNDIIEEDRIGNNFHFVAAGGVLDGLSKTEYPLVVKFHVNTLENLLYIDKFSVLNDMPNKHIVNLKAVKDNQQIKYIISLNDDLSIIDNTSVYVSAIDIDFNIVWSEIIKGEKYASHHGLQTIEYYNNKIYVVGETDDAQKQKNQLVYKNSGLIACYAISGQPLWRTKVSLSSDNEYFYSLFFYQNNLYAIGEYGRIYYGNTLDSYGNGLISKIDINTGEIIKSYTINNPYIDKDTVHRAYINTGVVLGNEIVLAGIVNEVKENGPYQAWFIKIDPAKL